MDKVKAVADDSSSFMGGFVPPRPPAIPESWTTPAPPQTAATALPMPMVDVLDGLVQMVPGVRGALLASVDGFGLAHSTSMADEPAHPAMLAAAIGLAQQLAAMGGGQSLHQLVIDHDAGLLLVWPIGTQRVLALLASTRVDQRELRTAVRNRSSVLAGATR
ncbi:MAG TPA: roadblock/LC7 domain-containing protein [Ilumatobacteraceae bacterium]|nr:roadblock/LC7 domain-containing protein [Ilumatobacteraceae bacterium]